VVVRKKIVSAIITQSWSFCTGCLYLGDDKIIVLSLVITIAAIYFPFLFYLSIINIKRPLQNALDNVRSFFYA
jgi:hypothetical protein